jgi:hypothetical protein
MVADTHSDKVSDRIKELGEKATQLLLFLTFALLAAVTLRTAQPCPTLGPCQMTALRLATRFWVVALLPILLCVLPLKELSPDNDAWYGRVRYFKVVTLWLAIALITIGAGAFLCALW